MTGPSTAVESFLLERVEAGQIPGAVWIVAGPGGALSEGAVGHAVLVPDREPAALDTIYDLASLTKPLVTSFLCLRLRRELGLSLDQVAQANIDKLASRLERNQIQGEGDYR